MVASRPAASSTSARTNRTRPGGSGSVCGPRPLSALPRCSTRSTPRARALSRSSSNRRSPRRPSEMNSSDARPSLPSVATTTTTRCPSAAARASVPEVSSASSSGWAWKASRVRGIGSILSHARVCVVKVALLSDCYLPRLGGIEVQVHDLAARLRERGHEVSVFTATPGAQGQRAGAVDLVDGVPVHRLALRLPFELPVNPLAPPELRRRLLHGGYDVAHVHMGVVSPFAVDAARVTTAMGLPTTMT